MTDGISINQFRTQIDQQSTNLDAKVKLDGDGGLKTFGKSFLGKVACWFQKSSTRKAQSNEVRSSFVSALRKEYGSNQEVRDVLDGVRGGGKRLSLRTAKQAFAMLDSHRSSFGEQALSLYSEMMDDVDVSNQLKSMGYEQGSLDQNQLEDMVGEITKNLARLGRTVNESTAKNTARQTIVGYVAKNLPINNVNDAVKILSHTTGPSLEDAVQRVFDHFQDQEGGLQKLQDCSLQMMGLEISKTTDGGTLLRGNSIASKLITKTLLLMTETQNNDLINGVSDLIPNEIPAPIIDSTSNTSKYTGNRASFNNPEFFKLSNQLTTGALNQLQDSWAKNISPETKQFFNRIMTTANEQGTHLGEGVGKKILAAVLILRLINPSFTGKEGAVKVNEQINELRKSGNPDQQRLNFLNGQSKLLVSMTRPLQNIANCMGQSDPEQYLSNLVGSKISQEDVPFILKQLNAFNTLLDTISEVPQD